MTFTVKKGADFSKVQSGKITVRNQFLHFDHLLQVVVGQKGQALFGVLQDLRFDACIRYAHANP
jgi:hypothetical protein